ncbi:hypothetical protein ACFFIX_12360 [Metabacillus herbersteinensis]|uniref:SH3b domain-containing protein n=1 Tax=Metabacillus herbersteinensis TaxID=283816 RepID=A0ABV6GEW1_9BACI
MLKKKIIPITLVFGLGFAVSSVSLPVSKASADAVLASVEWVLSKINPLEDRVASLEAQIQQLSDGDNSGGSLTPIQDKSTLTITSPTIVKSGAGSHYSTMLNAPQNTILTFYQDFTNSITGEKWYLVRLSNNRLGAILANKAQVSVTPYSGSYTKVVMNQNAPIRRGASSSYEVYYTAARDSVVNYHSTYTNSISGEKWYLVNLSSGKVGAVSAKHAEVIK